MRVSNCYVCLIVATGIVTVTLHFVVKSANIINKSSQPGLCLFVLTFRVVQHFVISYHNFGEYFSRKYFLNPGSVHIIRIGYHIINTTISIPNVICFSWNICMQHISSQPETVGILLQNTLQGVFVTAKIRFTHIMLVD